ncbi:hemolymph lipopolysaccharide-binding protein-like [Neodiprion fabricii]|uniref:hemolymph lipopolysaccharide-binding protein-like n=1 Tax=Neodiprion fabricii TaxID=2872261 RepID=UPI001ED92849|nr:hemolymph lipopolysaccharide-binding protein-like [Neodiprion fabricii]XP_046409435.1 hemolymph lipopolysaccharide-binding protein-like [Neodiprion fabricii]
MRKLIGILPVLVILVLVKVDSRNHHHHRILGPKSTDYSNCPAIDELHNLEPPEIADDEPPVPKPAFCTVIPEDYCKYTTSPHAYKLHLDERLSWTEANERCKEENGKLVIIENGAQYDIVRFMGRYYLGRGIIHFHIGFKRESAEYPWVTINGHRLPFVKWAAGEPNNYGVGEHCGAYMAVYNKTNGFNDVACRQRFYFMCEIKVEPKCE